MTAWPTGLARHQAWWDPWRAAGRLALARAGADSIQAWQRRRRPQMAQSGTAKAQEEDTD